jgi:hypothetical protein
VGAVELASVDIQSHTTHGAAVEHEGGAHGALLLKGDVGLGAVLLDALELAAELGLGGVDGEPGKA